MCKRKLCIAIGGFLILTGIFIPSSALINFLRTVPPGDIQKQLLLGATIFKIGLVIFGLLVLVPSKFYIWKSEMDATISSALDLKKEYITLPIAFILLASFVFRIYGLNLGLWFDEIVTYVNYAKLPFGEIITTYDSQNNHILYSLFAHASFQVFGESAWALRLPSALFGVASIWAIYLLGREVSTTREALLSAALLAFSYHHIWFSQNARGYTVVLFCTILSSWLLIRGFRESRLQIWVFYAITISLGAYTHMTMFFVVAGHFIIYLIMLIVRINEFSIKKWISFFFGFCLAGLFVLQLYSLILPQILGGTLMEGAERANATWKSPLWSLLEFLKGMDVSFTSNVFSFIALLIFGVGLFSFIREKSVVVLLLIIPFLLAITVIMIMGHPMFPRSFFFAMGFGGLVFIRGTMVSGHILGKLMSLSYKKSDSIGVTLCAVLVFMSAVSVYRVYAPKQDYLGALNFVEEKSEPGDIVVTLGVTAKFPYNRYYNMDWETVESLEELNKIVYSAKNTWLLYTMPLYLRSAYPEIMDSIEHDFKVVRQFYGTLGGGAIFVCRSRKS